MIDSGCANLFRHTFSLNTGRVNPRPFNRAAVSATSSADKKKTSTADVIAKLAHDNVTTRLAPALLAEAEEQMKERQRMFEPGALKRLQREGAVLSNLEVLPSGRLYSQFLWDVYLPKIDKLPFHRFKHGEDVWLSSLEGNCSKRGQKQQQWVIREGTVEHVENDRIRVAIGQEYMESMIAASRSGVKFRLDKCSTDVTTARQLQALEYLEKSKGYADNNIGQCRVRLILLRHAMAATHSVQRPAWATNKDWLEKVAKLVFEHPGLNASQKVAIARSFTRTFSLWQGPPGTGKTRTLLAYIEIMCKMSTIVSGTGKLGSILAVAHTNAAVDNLVEGLLHRGVRVVRIGQPAKVREELRSACVDAQAEISPLGQKAAVLRTKAQEVLEKAVAVGVSEQESFLAQRQASALWREADRTLQDAIENVIGGAEVIAATCTGAMDSTLKGTNFRIIVVDEAAQATEPATLIPLVKGPEQVIMAGDPNQLPATVISTEAKERGLDIALFSQLVDVGLEMFMLDTQYRMHPDIASYPSQQFYKGKLKSGIKQEDRALLLGVPWINSCPVYFYDSDGQGREQVAANDFGKSYSNLYEAETAVQVLLTVWSSNKEREEEITAAILSPYNGQVRLLTSLLAKRAPTVLSSRNVTISTIDGYQGREADLIILTTVRSNGRKELGFVTDERRMNVAITRAKRGLVVVGDAAVLSSDKNWRSWLHWLDARLRSKN